jgi:hypothetical protein
MPGRWCGLLCFVFLLSSAQLCYGGELAGKLERVDLKTVTLRSTDNQKLILKVDGSDRKKAAPYLGKSVTVRFRIEKGEHRAVLFQSFR